MPTHSKWRDFVARNRSSLDARRIGLSLTPARRGALDGARAAIHAQENSLRGRFTPAETSALMGMLKRIYD